MGAGISRRPLLLAVANQTTRHPGIVGRTFEAQGFEPTSSREHELGIEKIAIYVDLKDMLPSHVAKSDGRTWKSKLGKGQDIAHSSLELLEGEEQDDYGIVERILRKPLKSRLVP